MINDSSERGPSTASKREFYFDGMEVGYLDQLEFPCTAGTYLYTPYRGFGHYKMQTALAGGQNPRCSYRVGDSIVWFTVRKGLERGTLEFFEFQTCPIE